VLMPRAWIWSVAAFKFLRLSCMSDRMAISMIVWDKNWVEVTKAH
jgi:hypothetical protein